MLTSGVNLDAFLWVNRLAVLTPWLHSAMQWYAVYGLGLLAVLLLVGLWVERHRVDSALARAGWACLAPIVAFALNQPIVTLVGEARPYSTLDSILVLATRTTDPGFPSDHATIAGATAVGLFLVSRRLGWISAAAGLLLAFSRVYIAAHYPFDVVAGLAFGGLIAGLGWLATRRLLVPLVRGLRGQPGLRAMFGEAADPL